MDQSNREHFKAIDGFDNYEISDCGRVRITKSGKIMKNQIRRNGYYMINLHKKEKIKSMLVHRLVADAFCKNPNELPVVDHIDKNTKNNYYKNLRWVSRSKNSTHRNKQTNNTSKIIGVCHKKSINCFVAQWRDINKNQCEKSFSINKYGYDEALRLAKNARLEAMKKYENYHEEIGCDGQVDDSDETEEITE